MRFWVCRSTTSSLWHTLSKPSDMKNWSDWSPLHSTKRKTVCRELHLPALKTDPTYSRCTLLHLPEIQDHLAAFRPPPGDHFLCQRFSIFVALAGPPVFPSLWLAGWGKGAWPRSVHFVWQSWTFFSVFCCLFFFFPTSKPLEFCAFRREKK